MPRKIKPTCLTLEAYLDAGYSLNKIKDLTGYSVPTIAKFCDDCGIKKPSIGRPKGFKMSEESKEKIRKAIRKE